MIFSVKDKQKIIGIFNQKSFYFRKRYNNDYLVFLDESELFSDNLILKIKNLKTRGFKINKAEKDNLNLFFQRYEKIDRKKHKIKVFYNNININTPEINKNPLEPIKTSKKLTIAEIIKKYNLKV